MGSIRASKEGIEKVKQARNKKGWNQDANTLLTQAGVSRSTLQRFEKGIPIRQEYFVSICKAVGVKNWEEIVDDSLSPQQNLSPEFSQYDSSWVGREKLLQELSDKVRGSSRLLLILGLTGIGKTALAEKLALDLDDWLQGDWKNRFLRANFDYKEKATDFASVAKQWLEELGEKISPEDNKPKELLNKLVKRLRENQILVLIDSLERLLTGNQEDGWGDFADEWWEKFFISLLSAESCQSRIIVTSQDLPVNLVDPRYKNFWHKQVLYGLEESEQQALFEITGLDVSQESPDQPILLRIGKAYKGHPLVLRVIIGEIFESFDGNVQAYWHEVSSKIEEVEKALAEAERGKIVGEKYEWKLHKLTIKLQREVNKQRLEDVFERLKQQVNDAYVLICTASVYRSPVQREGWLIQLTGLIEDLEHQECSLYRQEKALEELINRFLVEESVNHNNKRVFGQHNLVRSVALEQHKKLLQSLITEVSA